MSTKSRLQAIKWGLLTLAAIGLALWGLVRPPLSTAGSNVVKAIDLSGQIRGTVTQSVHAVRLLTTITDATPDDVVIQRREMVNGMVTACERLGDSVKAADSGWIPVAEAVVLLSKTREFAQAALVKTPTRQVTKQDVAAAGSLETDPDRIGMTRETVQLIESRANDLMSESDNLLDAIQVSASRAAFSRGTWFGLEARDYLLLCLMVAVVLGFWANWQAQAWSETAPAEALITELKLEATSDPDAAIERCYRQSAVVLNLADEILTQANIRKVGSDVSQTAVAR